MKTNMVTLCDYDRDDALSNLTLTEEMDRRRNERRREHRREKRVKLGCDAAFIFVVCACCFIIGYYVGGF